jgi:hypothetical protein
MNAFNRVLISVLALLWIAAWAGVVYLMWEPSRDVDISNRYLEFVFDITISGSDRILATLLAAAAMVVGLGLIGAQFVPSRRGPMTLPPESDPRYRELRERLDSLQRRIDERPVVDNRPVTPAEQTVESRSSSRRWGIAGRR